MNHKQDGELSFVVFSVQLYDIPYTKYDIRQIALWILRFSLTIYHIRNTIYEKLPCRFAAALGKPCSKGEFFSV